MDWVGILKAAYITLCGWFASLFLYFLPLQGLGMAISIAFSLNLAAGIFSGLVIQGESISFKKGLFAFAEIAIYLIILSNLYIIGDKMKNAETVMHLASMITWAWIAFYNANFSKNLKRIVPSSRGINFYNFVSNLEFVKMIPYFKKFEKYEKLQQRKDS